VEATVDPASRRFSESTPLQNCNSITDFGSKPFSVKITDFGSRPFSVKVTDFGLGLVSVKVSDLLRHID